MVGRVRFTALVVGCLVVASMSLAPPAIAGDRDAAPPGVSPAQTARAAPQPLLHWSGTISVTKRDTTGTNGHPSVESTWTGTVEPATGPGFAQAAHDLTGAYTSYTYLNWICPPTLSGQVTTSDPVSYLWQDGAQVVEIGGNFGETTLTMRECDGASHTRDVLAPSNSPSGLSCGGPWGVTTLGSDGHYKVDTERQVSCHDGQIVEKWSIHLTSLETYDCDGAVAPLGSPVPDRKSTVLDATSFLRIAAAPDPDFGMFGLQLRWCVDGGGAQLMAQPNVYAELSTNWSFLATLETLGFTPNVGPVTVGTTSSGARAKVTYGLQVDAVAVASNVLPTTKILERAGKLIRRYHLDRKAGVRAVRAAKALRASIRKTFDEWEDALEKTLQGRFARVPGVSGGDASLLADAITDVLEDAVADLESRIYQYAVDQFGRRLPGVTTLKTWVKKAYKKYLNPNLSLWRVDVGVTLQPDGSVTVDNDTRRLLLDDEWVEETTQ